MFTSRSLIIVFVVALLSGCASVSPHIESNVTSFHTLPPESTSAMKVIVLPWRDALGESLEFQAYAAAVGRQLTARGASVVTDGKEATHVLFLDYGIDDGQFVTSTYSIPHWGVTGYSGATTTGTVSTYGNTSYVNANTTLNKTYGVTGYSTGVRTDQVFSRVLNADLVELSKPPLEAKKVYEARLRSQGSCSNLATVMPAFIAAMFAEFPGESGRSRRVVSTWDGSC